MATPVMWQACRLSNSVYSALLGYPFPLQIDPITYTFRVERQFDQLKKFNVSVFVIATVFVSLLDSIFQARVVKSIDVPFNMLIFHIAASFMCSFGLGLLYVFLHFKDDLWNKYVNMLIAFESKLVGKKGTKTNKVKVKIPNFGILILTGNNNLI